MKTTLNKIEDVFSIFHDGTISTYVGDKNLLRIEIDCPYLAERINPSYRYFYVDLDCLEKLEFIPWMNPLELPQIFLKEANDVFQAPLEILSAKIENDHVKVYCNQHDTVFDYCGGTLLIDCKSITVFDQENNPITIDKLASICNEYWDDFGKNVEEVFTKK